MAFAADSTSGLTDISGIANEDAIQVAYDLSIVTGNPDGTFLPDKAVNRAEFAAMLTRALAIPDSALSGYTTTSFLDTTGYTWAVPYLAFCQSKGILLGDGAGNVMPGRTVTVNEAMTMSLRAIGYTANSSLLVGAWPSNYVSIAQNEELYDDVSKDTTVNKASAAQIIYNLLTVQKVAVNTDGTTDYLWKDKKEETAANLLNTNHNCDEIEDAILGSTAGTTYDDAIINITKNLGAYGTAYINDDDELIAFTKDSTALTGKLNDKKDKFEVGDIEYDIDDSDNDFTSKAAFFINGDDDLVLGDDDKITIDGIEAWAAGEEVEGVTADGSDDGETVTLNVDLSGKTIKDIYSVVAWSASDYDLADEDVQEEIADLELFGFDFIDDDDGNIDFNSFELIGVASLDDIEEDDVVYVYADGDDIRRVAVGTETIEGVVDEIEYDDDDAIDTVTIADKEYDLSPVATSDATDIDVDSEGTFYLDAFGEIFDFDGTSGSADTFGIVEAWDNKYVSDFDNPKIKLYLSDDSEKTLYFAENYDDSVSGDDIEWVTSSALGDITSSAALLMGGKDEKGIFTTGKLIGYSLDSSGDIDTIDVTSKEYADQDVTFQSTKVLKAGGKSYSIDSDAVVFTYKDDPTKTGDYDVASLDDVETGELSGAAVIILNDDDDVVAIFTDEYNTNGDDYIYGVVNKKTAAKDDGGDTVSRFTGFIDGSSFTYKADDEYTAKAGTFDVYKIKLDASNIITEIKALNNIYKYEDESGYLTSTTEKITKLESDKTVITTTEDKYTVSDEAVVYEYDLDDEEFSVSKLSALKDNGKYYVRLYDTEGRDADGIADLVIFYEE